MAGGRILGVSAGTRYVGIAVLDGSHLIDWKVQTFSGSWSKQKKQAITEAISTICATYAITTIALKSPDPIRSSPALLNLTEKICACAEATGLGIYRFNLMDIFHYCHGKGKNIHERISAYICERYPLFTRECHKEGQATDRYYTRMFEAILIAEMAYSKK